MWHKVLNSASTSLSLQIAILKIQATVLHYCKPFKQAEFYKETSFYFLLPSAVSLGLKYP